MFAAAEVVCQCLCAFLLRCYLPPGLRQMPESERLETLALLLQNRQEVESKLSALSITNETQRMVRGAAKTEH